VLVAEREAIAARLRPAPAAAVAFHSPCTLQHGQQLRGGAESLLRLAGFELTPVRDAHLCCGSAGTYSLLQPELATRLRDNKLAALQAGQPSQIATANVGCQCHLAGASNVPVRHWIELLEERMR
jgi:glycolate oxidase iron-sulfur subunit